MNQSPSSARTQRSISPTSQRELEDDDFELVEHDEAVSAEREIRKSTSISSGWCIIADEKRIVKSQAAGTKEPSPLITKSKVTENVPILKASNSAEPKVENPKKLEPIPAPAVPKIDAKTPQWVPMHLRGVTKQKKVEATPAPDIPKNDPKPPQWVPIHLRPIAEAKKMMAPDAGK